MNTNTRGNMRAHERERESQQVNKTFQYHSAPSQPALLLPLSLPPLFPLFFSPLNLTFLLLKPEPYAWQVNTPKELLFLSETWSWFSTVSFP